MLRPEGGNGAAATLAHTLTQAPFVIANKRGVFKVFKACSRVFFIFHLDLFSQSGSVWAEFTALHESRGRPILHPGSCFSQLLLGLIVLQHVRATELLLFTLVGTFLLYKSILHSLEKKPEKQFFRLSFFGFWGNCFLKYQGTSKSHQTPNGAYMSSWSWRNTPTVCPGELKDFHSEQLQSLQLPEQSWPITLSWYN